MLSKIFESVLISQSTMTAGTFVLCIVASLIIGILASLVYMRIHKNTGFSQSYVLTIIMLPGIISLIILLINDLSKALGLAGAFSLVRFRSVPGDPKDIAYIFFSMAAGLACGLGYIGYAFLFFIIISAIMLILNKLKFGMPHNSNMTLKITIPENLNYQGLFDNIFNEYTNNWKLKRIKTADFGTLFELIYSIEMDEDTDQKKFIDKIRTLNGNLNVTLVLYKYDDQVYEK